MNRKVKGEIIMEKNNEVIVDDITGEVYELEEVGTSSGTKVLAAVGIVAAVGLTAYLTKKYTEKVMLNAMTKVKEAKDLTHPVEANVVDAEVVEHE